MSKERLENRACTRSKVRALVDPVLEPFDVLLFELQLVVDLLLGHGRVAGTRSHLDLLHHPGFQLNLLLSLEPEQDHYWEKSSNKKNFSFFASKENIIPVKFHASKIFKCHNHKKLGCFRNIKNTT